MAYEFRSASMPHEAWGQGEFWYDKQGNGYTIAHMNPNHAANAWKKLSKMASTPAQMWRLASPLMVALANRASQIQPGPPATQIHPATTLEV